MGSADLADPDASIAQVEVTDVSDVDCFARVVEAAPAAGLEAGAQAVLQKVTDVRLQRGVLVDIADPALKQAVETEIQNNGKGFVVLGGAGTQLDFQVTVNARGDFEIQDPGDQPIPNLRPAVPAALDGVAQVVARLVHLSKYANVRELDVPDKGAAAVSGGFSNRRPVWRRRVGADLSRWGQGQADDQEYPTTQPG